ncbi:MAG: HAD-IC family P-type ATPase [Thermoleophilia bacterium]|nr:HAD-IC family P-type ATPase [Thermoleophilia bacterium]
MSSDDLTRPLSPRAPVPPPPGAAGLTEAQAAAVLASRGGPPPPPESSRSVASIVRANTLTVFNLILVAFGVITLAAGDWRDALFVAILVANSGIGILQEMRSKRALDRLAALATPHARVVRDGRERHVAVGEVVPGDLVALGPGDQVVADGRIRHAEGLGLDESMLTGESLPVVRAAGDEIRAGSFCEEGAGTYVAEAVGADSYAQRLTGRAREFRHPLSPLQVQVNRLLLAMVALMIPLGVAFAVVLVRHDQPLRESVTEATAGVVTLVPEGLILLVSVAYAISALRMARRGALAQQLSAIESLCATDVLCLDKTGTLTEDALRVVDLVPAEGVAPETLRNACATYGRSSPPGDAMLQAMGAVADVDPAAPSDGVPFSSRWMWSALTVRGCTLVLGAPEVVLARSVPGHGLDALVADHQAMGRRVVALAEARIPPARPAPGDSPPQGLIPLGLVVLAEAMRQGVGDAIGYLRAEGVRPVVISGDDPATVAAVARDAGVPVDGTPLDGRHLPADDAELRRALRAAGVAGRVSPEGKQRIVEILARDGNVTMMGDGVNDVPALKTARVAVCPGSATDMARTVCDLVLVRGGFETIPPMIREGRMVLRNLQRVAKLFVAKSILAAFLILTIGLSPEAYPFLPRHLTLASALTVGIPAFILALAPSDGPWRSDRFLRDVTRFGVPAGVATGLGVVSAFLLAKNVLGVPLADARTVAVIALVLIGVYLVVLLEGPAATARRTRWTLVMCGALLLLFAIVMSMGSWRAFFALEAVGPASFGAALVGALLAAGGLWATDARFAPPVPAIRRLAGRL